MSDAKCPLGLSEWQHDEYSHLTRENVRLLTMMRKNAAQRAVSEAELELYKLRTEARMRELQSKVSRQRSAIKRLEDKRA